MWKGILGILKIPADGLPRLAISLSLFPPRNAFLTVLGVLDFWWTVPWAVYSLLSTSIFILAFGNWHVSFHMEI